MNYISHLKPLFSTLLLTAYLLGHGHLSQPLIPSTPPRSAQTYCCLAAGQTAVCCCAGAVQCAMPDPAAATHAVYNYAYETPCDDDSYSLPSAVKNIPHLASVSGELKTVPAALPTSLSWQTDAYSFIANLPDKVPI